jgi:enolase
MARAVCPAGEGALAEKVRSVEIRKVLDSRGNATVEVEVATRSARARVAAPSGASTGATEVKALPEGGAEAALRVFRRRAAPKLLGVDVEDQEAFDEALEKADGTPDFSGIGGNPAVAASLACARCAAMGRGLPLWAYLSGRRKPERWPGPQGNLIGGGAHAVGGTDIQEYLAFTRGAPPSKSVFANAMAHRFVKEDLKAMFPGEPLGRGDEGAWIAATTNEKAMGVLTRCLAKASEATGLDVAPALDFAASEFFRSEKYHYKDRSLTPAEQVDYVEMLVEAHGIVSVEDPLAQHDFGSFAELTRRVGARCMVVGDDIFTTNVERIKRGIHERAANAVLIKPNQIGTLTGTRRAVDLARRAGWATVTSHRSGETSDDTIAHLAVAFGSVGLKTGAVGGERVAKLNELLRIEEALGKAGRRRARA